MDSVAKKKAINQALGRRLKMARKWRNLELRELAEKSGLTTAMLEKHEIGEIPIPADKLLEISQILDLPTDYFLKPLDIGSKDRP